MNSLDTQLRQNVLKRIFEKMNAQQQQAVFQTKGPVLILAGAGSGKTTVIVNRIANLIRFGDGYHCPDTVECAPEELRHLRAFAQGTEPAFEGMDTMIADHPVRPWQILAITFTNKAAGELKERICRMLGERGNDVWAATFHSTCARMLRKDADRLGYSSNFTIYDTDDCKRLMKDCMKIQHIDEKVLPYKSILSAISSAKDSLISPEEFRKTAQSDVRLKKIGELYSLYQRRLMEADAMDFDDLLMQTVLLLEQNPDVLEYYQNRFRYIMVDEYQDTNRAQYRFISLLAAKHRNLCVVGDDDQSIYKFRGATIENILSFENEYTDAKVFRLEQNYRSTSRILDAANAVIRNNLERKGKQLWTQNGEGEKILRMVFENEQDESAFIAETVLDMVAKGRKFSDFAVLYRLNAQASSIERAFVKSAIPYRVLAGLRFYEHKEVKDMLAYLSVLSNPADTVRLRRIINEPKRMIGDATVAAADAIAQAEGVPLFDVISRADCYAALSRSAVRLMEFAKMIDELRDAAEIVPIHDLYQHLLERTGYMEMLRAQGEEAQSRIENVQELASVIMSYEGENDASTLAGFLEEISLMSDIDNYDETADAVTMMTLHSAKGLEFPVVLIPGLEEGIFPGAQTIYHPEQIEEERRLAYVGLTRARERLLLSSCVSRTLYGSTTRNKTSRFCEEIPAELLEVVDQSVPRRPYSEWSRKPDERRLHFAQAAQSARRLGTGSEASAPPSGKQAAFHPGDSVRHPAFGDGMILSVKPMGNDTMLEVAFQTVGTKKLMSNFAKLTRL